MSGTGKNVQKFRRWWAGTGLLDDDDCDFKIKISNTYSSNMKRLLLSLIRVIIFSCLDRYDDAMMSPGAVIVSEHACRYADWFDMATLVKFCEGISACRESLTIVRYLNQLDIQQPESLSPKKYVEAVCVRDVPDCGTKLEVFKVGQCDELI